MELNSQHLNCFRYNRAVLFAFGQGDVYLYKENKTGGGALYKERKQIL